jgi:hypothetical protein
MNPPKKFPPHASPNDGRRAMNTAQTNRPPAHATRPPVAPPPPRPKPPAARPPTPKTPPNALQAKLQNRPQPPPQPGRAPAAPPVYRPQPTPKVLQLKSRAVGPNQPAPQAARPERPSAPTAPRPPLPGVSRPGTIQAKPRQQQSPTAAPPPPKARAPLRPRAGGGVVQPKTGGVRVHMIRLPPPRPVAPAAHSGGRGGGVIQRDVVKVFQKDFDTGDKDVNYAVTLQLQAIIESLDPIMSEAMDAVDNGTGMTNSTAAYIRDNGSKAAAAKRGTAIHAETYVLVAQALAQLNGHLHMLTETSQSSPPHFPYGIKSGRPDIRIALSHGLEAILDVTSPSEAKKKHCAGRHYEENKQVIFIGEMPYGGEDG